jgi:hypothetical protein
MRLSSTVRRTSRDFAVEVVTRRLMLKIAVNLKAEAIKPAIALTSGTISTKQLADMDHPFARRNRTAQGRLRPGRSAEIRAARKSVGRIGKLPINRQSGALQKSMQIQIRSSGDVWRLYFYTNHPHAVVLSPKGTKHMVPRGFLEELTRRMTSQRMVSRLRGVIRRTRLR